MMALWKQMRWSPGHLGEFLTDSVNCQDVLQKTNNISVRTLGLFNIHVIVLRLFLNFLLFPYLISSS